MPNRKFNSRELRQLAEEFFQRIAEDEEIAEVEREDFVTSLVRQWVTYDGNATFFLGDQQIYLILGKTPLGRPCIVPQTALPGWLDKLEEDWRIDPEELPGIIDQLNLGQSAEVINSEGVPLRLWVNPKERKKGIEPLVKQPVPPGTKRDYRKIASNVLEQQLSFSADEEEMEELALSVVKQWQQYQGHACLFIDGGQQLVFHLTEKDDGCNVTTTRLRGSLEPLLSSLGFSPEEIPDVIARINLGHEVEFRNQEGIPSVLWHDPKERRIQVRPREESVKKQKFHLGVLEVQEEAAMVLARSGHEASYFVQRHASGDWGDMSDKAMAENDQRLRMGQDVVSCYHTKNGEKILVCTTADRQKTVVYVPVKWKWSQE